MTTYYVSKNGSNSNSGLSTTSAWRAIQKGLDALGAGDTLNIMAGTYVPGQEGADHWRLDGARGTATREITIQNYASDVVTLDGQASGNSNGFPRGGLKFPGRDWKRIGDYKLTWKGLFELFHCQYVTVDGLNIKNSLGIGIEIRGDDSPLLDYDDGKAAFSSHDITIKNCLVHNCHNRNLRIQHSWQVTLETSEFSLASYASGGGGSLNVVNGYYIYVDRNIIHQQAGEAFTIDANNYNSRNCYITNNVVFDCEGPLLIHAATHVIVAGNLLYTTPQDRAAPNHHPSVQHRDGQGFVGGNKGITVKAAECTKTNQRPAKFIAVVANVIMNRGIGIVLKNDIDRPECSERNPNWNPANMMKLEDVYCVGNTVVDCEYNYRINNNTGENNVFKNNISVNSNAKRHVNTATRGNITGWDADYNIYHGSTPNIVSNLVGANDITGNPNLADDSFINKGRNSKQPQAGYWANFDLLTEFDDATGFRIPSGSIAEDAGTTVSGPAGWAEMDDYLDWAFDFQKLVNKTTSGNPLRGATWDIGAHEFLTGTARPTVTAAITGGAEREVGEALGFTAVGAGGTAPLTYLWDFGDGDTTTTEDPTKTYTAEGFFRVKCTVTDDVDLTGSDTVDVKIVKDIGPTAGTADIEQVVFTAGASSYVVTAKPKAVFVVGTGATTDDTLKNDSRLMMGIWGENDGGSQYSAALWANDLDNLSFVRTNQANDGFILFVDDLNQNNEDVATIDSVTASAVNMSWPGNEDSEKFITYNFAGDAITNVKATFITLGNENDTVDVTGDYNFAIMPSSLTTGFDVQRRRGCMSLAFLSRDGGTAAYHYQNRNNEEITAIIGQMNTEVTDVVSQIFTRDLWVVKDSWDTSRIRFKAMGGDINADIPVLLMNISGAQIKCGSFFTPTVTGAVSYTEPGFDGQMLWIMGSMFSGVNGDKVGDNTAGVFNYHSVDVADVEYTLAITSEDEVEVSNESSYYSNAYDPRIYDGSSEATGALAIIANGFEINETVAGTGVEQVYCEVETTTAVTSLTVNFMWYKSGTDPVDQEDIRAGELIQFEDLSATGSLDTITAWEWDFGDGNTSTSENPTNTYTKHGIYTVELKVDDDVPTTDVTLTKTIQVYLPLPTNGFVVADDITPASGTGVAPLTCAIDGSAVTAGSGETIDGLRWTVTQQPISDPDEDVGNVDDDDLWEARFLSDPADSVDFTIGVVGTFDLMLEVFYENVQYPVATYFYDEVWGVTEVADTEVVVITSDIGAYRTPVGPYTLTFIAEVDGIQQLDDADGTGTYESILWDPGDGSGTDTNWSFTHTYAAVAAATGYDVAVTITPTVATFTLDDTITDYITIYPPLDPPPTKQTMEARIANLRAAFYVETDDWVQEGAPNTSVYKADMTMAWAVGATWRLLEDGDILTAQVSVAACQAAAGSYYITFLTPTLTIYVHPTGSTSPITNGSEYRWIE